MNNINLTWEQNKPNRTRATIKEANVNHKLRQKTYFSLNAGYCYLELNLAQINEMHGQIIYFLH